MGALGAGLVLLQRFSLPFTEGAVSISALALSMAFLGMVILRIATIDPTRLLVIFLVLALSGAILITIGGSVASLALIAAIWVAAVAAFPDASRLQRAALAGVVHATILACTLALVQAIVSFLNGALLDPVSELPESWLVQGFNTSDPISFGESLMKSNGMLFLEPSLLSLFAALSLLAVVVGAVGERWDSLRTLIVFAILVGGWMTSVAASGMVVLPFLVVGIVARGRRAWAPLALVGVGAGAALAALPAWSSALAHRVFTTSLEVGSNEARLVRPYQYLLARSLDAEAIFGFGPGAARQYVRSLYSGWQSEIATPTMAKLGFEYGLVGLVVVILIVLLVLRGSKLPWLMRGAVVVAVLVPTDGLTNVLLAGLAILCSLPQGPERRICPNGLAKVPLSTNQSGASTDSSLRAAYSIGRRTW